MIPEIVADQTNELTDLRREMLSELLAVLHEIDMRVVAFDRRIAKVFGESEACQRIAKVRGVGPKTATAVIAAVDDGRDFDNGRHMAGCLALFPDSIQAVIGD